MNSVSLEPSVLIVNLLSFAMCFCLEHPVPTLGQQQHYTHACAKTTVFHQNACCSGTEFGWGIYCYTYGTRAIPGEQFPGRTCNSMIADAY